MDWNQIWNDIVAFFETNVWNIILFFAVLFLGIIVIKIVINITKRILNKTRIEKIALGFVIGIIKVVLYLCLVLGLLSIIGIQITGLITALSALLLAVGLALQNNIANVANGLIVVSSKMFKKGDYISVDGQEGKVIQISFLYTTIVTSDNKRITIPNSTIVNNSVVDYDTCGTRRVEWKFTVAYESDVEKVKKLILDCIVSNGNVMLDPAPFCRLNALGSSSIEFVARCWCDSEDYWGVYYDVLELVYDQLKRNKISIPYDQVEFRERKDKPVLPVSEKSIPKRIEKIRKTKHSFDLENMDFGALFNKKKKQKNKIAKAKININSVQNLLKTYKKYIKNIKKSKIFKKKNFRLNKKTAV